LYKKDAKYKSILNECVKTYRDNLKHHFQADFDKGIHVSENKSKSMWGFINAIQKKTSHRVIEVVRGGVRVSDMCLANDFNDHFFSVLGSHDDEVDNVFLEAHFLSKHLVYIASLRE